MITVRVSTLEQFRRVMTTEYAPESELIGTLHGKPPAPSWQMEAGTAWHKVLENPVAHAQIDFTDPAHPTQYYLSGDYTFSAEAVNAALECIGPGVREMLGSKEIAGVRVQGTCDHMRGLLVQDAKTKFSTPDARDYEKSLQWRLYLLIHGAACFKYNLFDFRDPKDGYCELKDIVSFRFWPYDGMADDCAMWVKCFLDWAGQKKLLGYLDPQRIRGEVA